MRFEIEICQIAFNRLMFIYVHPEASSDCDPTFGGRFKKTVHLGMLTRA